MPESDDWKFWACGEFCGILPNGQIRPADVVVGDGHWRVNAGQMLRLASPRNGWASFRVVVEGAGQYAVSVRVKGEQIAVELFREFYHQLGGKDEWQPDALVPVRATGQKQVLPDPENQVPGQTAQSFWVDLFIPAGATVGTHVGKVTLKAGAGDGPAHGTGAGDGPAHDGSARLSLSIDLAIDVMELAYPEADCVQLDHNSYGSTFLEKEYPRTVPRKPGPKKTAAIIGLIHKYHALVFEHHGLYHQLGYGHSGATNAIFAPAVSGDGRGRHVSDWSVYDAHYGPLLDGSAFAAGRRKPAPIYSIHTPFNPGWPADYLGFGHKGYEVEWTNVLGDFDRHFRANGWTGAILEYFFNHKKRYRFFEWDGDEPRYERDDCRFRYYRKLLDEATNPVNPLPLGEGRVRVPWRFRIDASWRQKIHWTALAGVTDMWINGGFVSMFEKEVHAGPMSRGDVVWTYSGGTAMTDPSADIIQYLYRTWIRDFTGNVNWQTVAGGADPWRASDGGRTIMMYPGERFGVAGPIPCIRLKVQRNAMQDVNLLDLAAKKVGKGRIKAELIPTIPIELWYEPPEGVKTLPPCEWTTKVLRRPVAPDQLRPKSLDALWWQPVRDYARRQACSSSAETD